MVDPHDRVDALEDVVRADAQRLVGGLGGELVATVGQSVVAVVQAGERHCGFRAGRGDGSRQCARTSAVAGGRLAAVGGVVFLDRLRELGIRYALRPCRGHQRRQPHRSSAHKGSGGRSGRIGAKENECRSEQRQDDNNVLQDASRASGHGSSHVRAPALRRDNNTMNRW